MMSFSIGNKIIDKNSPTYIIAELSCNHNKNFSIALELIKQAYLSGADAIKVQTFRPDTITIDCDNEYFQINSDTLWDGQTLYELYDKAYMPWEWHEPLKKEANRLGMDFFSSPFDITAVDMLEKLDVPCYKIASFEAMDHILLKKIASTGKPVIMSTGIAELNDIAESVNILRNNGCGPLCILKCTSQYPAPIENANLKTIKNIQKTFNVVSGLSDHTLGTEVPIVAVCLGARVIEKHFTLSRNSGSPDDAFSLEPHEFKQMVTSIRKAEKAIGNIKYTKTPNEKKSKMFSRSLFIICNMKKGDTFTKDNLKSIRPGHGLHTRYYDEILGKKCKMNISKGTPLSWNLIE